MIFYTAVSVWLCDDRRSTSIGGTPIALSLSTYSMDPPPPPVLDDEPPPVAADSLLLKHGCLRNTSASDSP